MTPRVKICGIRRVEDALLAAELGASSIGLIFWPGSARFIDPFRARRIVASLPPFVTAVGVFVDQPEEYIAGVAGLVKLGAVQLHGHEAPASYARLRYRVIKAAPVGDAFDPASLDAIPARATVLLDAHDPVRHGGTGRQIDWSLAAAAARVRCSSCAASWPAKVSSASSRSTRPASTRLK